MIENKEWILPCLDCGRLIPITSQVEVRVQGSNGTKFVCSICGTK